MLRSSKRTPFLRLALAQMDPTVGDLRGNAEKIMHFVGRAKKGRADIVAFPELALTGYPPEDLVLKPSFIADNLLTLKRITGKIKEVTAIIGFIDSDGGGDIYNAAAVVSDGKIIDIYHKVHLPNYGVFDEKRYFKAGRRAPVYCMKDVRFGVSICEDIWHAGGPARAQSASGAELIININASPYETGKPETRRALIRQRASENRVIIAYLNTVGGQDELVFDGLSMVYDHTGTLMAQASPFGEEMMSVDIDIEKTREYRSSRARRPASTAKDTKAGLKTENIRVPEIKAPRAATMRKNSISGILIKEEEIYRALMLGTSDYIRKNGFEGAVIGLSGGVDSSLVAAVAADAIGSGNVTGVFMPSEYTSTESREDAVALAENLGINMIEVPIWPIMEEYKKSLAPFFRGLPEDITEENLQARIRGNLLMAMSNKFGWIVLTTGNKSEMSVGYATLYGDMAGGFAVIKDVPKTLVYSICRWRNMRGDGAVIPKRVLTKAPTAELRPGQKDSDSLPPYEALDPILKAYIEDETSFREIIKAGHDPEAVKKVIGMVDRSEYKRRQSPPGIKITRRAFGRDRRFPITNRYRSF